MSLSFDRSAWKHVALGDVARHVTDRTDPETSGLRRFLAGEHIPGDDLNITCWGTVGQDPMGPMFYKRFKPAHVLYVSRRTYLRKVAVPEFEGITGEKTFVLETLDSNVLLQEFLPFVLSSERFHAYAIANSRGSVNPYLNWGELAAYEFALPPLDEQQRIAALLWAIERHRRTLVTLDSVLTGDDLLARDTARRALLDHALAGEGSKWPLRSLGSLGAFVRGRRFTKKDYVDEGIGCIHYAHIFTHFDAVAHRPVAFVDESLKPSLRFAAPGDVVIAGTSETAQDVCKAVAWLGSGDVAVHDDCFIFKHDLDPVFASYLFASSTFHQQKAQFTSESKVVRVSAANLAKIEVPVPPRPEQERIAHAVAEILTSTLAVRAEITALEQTRASILAETFGGAR